MIKKHWQKINGGDNACIVAPSYGISASDDLEASLAKVMDIVEGYGLKAYIYPNAISVGNHSLFDNSHIRIANSDELRSAQFIDAFNNPDCDLVWAFRGGYGAIRLLSSLSKELEPQKVKPFIGFSDATILHQFINNVWNWPSIHFGMPAALQSVMQREDTKQSLQNIIFGSTPEVIFKLEPLNEDLPNNSVISGITAGGNMFCFEKLFGTKYSPVLSNRIIVLEDIDEPARKIDGFLQKLQITPGFEEIKAIIFATFTPLKDQAIFDRVFKDFSINSHVPAFKLDPSNTIGHGDINNAFPLGSEAIIKLSGVGFELNINSGMEALESYNEL